MQPDIIAVPADLLFASRIRAAAEQSGARVFVARNAKIALEHIAQATPALIIIDLDARSWDPIALVREAGEMAAGVEILGYVSHVRMDLIEAARTAGAKVIARSAFVRDLEQILSRQSGSR